MGAPRGGFREYLGPTALISLGFFTMGLMDPLYDNFVPLFLRPYVASMGARNSIMTIDNVFALFLIPLVAAWSDRTRTRIGRRMPFILATLPASALLFAGLPFAAAASLAVLLALILALNVFKQGARGPVVALMPDIVPGEHRSEANGVINMAGAAAGIIATLALGPLMGPVIRLPLLGPSTGKAPFILAALLVIASVILLFAFVRERGPGAKPEAGAPAGGGDDRAPVIAALRSLAGAKEKSALLILVAIFIWFFGYQGVLPCLSTYMLDVVGVPLGQTSLAMGAAAVAMIVFAVPSGIIASRLGRKRVVRASLLALVLVFVAIFLHDPAARALGLSSAGRLYSFLLLMFLFGGFWIAIVANSFPMLWQMATYADMGIYTGAYYVAKESSSIVSPPLTGLSADIFGIRSIFLIAAACMLAAFVVMGFVKRGESPTAPAGA